MKPSNSLHYHKMVLNMKKNEFKAVDNQGMAVKGKYTLMKSAITIR
jgi:hypothetical protein